MSGRASTGIRDALDGDEVREILRDTFFTPTPADGLDKPRTSAVAPAEARPSAPPVEARTSMPPEPVGEAPCTLEEVGTPDGELPSRRKRTSQEPGRPCKPRPEHYKVICISMYTEDLERLDAVVRELKRRGFTKANRSAVLRIAMEQMDLDRVPRGL